MAETNSNSNTTTTSTAKRLSMAGRVATPKLNPSPSSAGGAASPLSAGSNAAGTGKDAVLGGGAANASSADNGSILHKAVGARVKMTCAPHNVVLEGTIYTICQASNLVAVNTAPAPPNPAAGVAAQPGHFHLVPFTHIVSFELMGASEHALDSALPPVARADLDAARARQEAAVRKLKERDALRGKA